MEKNDGKKYRLVARILKADSSDDIAVDANDDVSWEVGATTKTQT